MASCGPPPLGRFLGPALLQFAFIRGGSLKVFTPRIKYFCADDYQAGAHTKNRRKGGTDHSRTACLVQWLFVPPPVPLVHCGGARPLAECRPLACAHFSLGKS